jgi:hypothetical protein
MTPYDDFILPSVVARPVSPAISLARAIVAANRTSRGADPQPAISTAILGDDDAVRDCVQRDPASATARLGPYGWDALTHVCFSRYLRLVLAHSDAFVRAATVLLDAGASANSGFREDAH